jgi:hypothetical protein
MDGSETLDLEFGDNTVDPLESGILDTEAQNLTMGLQEGDLDPQGLYRRKGYGTTFGRDHHDSNQSVTFGVEATPRKPLGRLLAAGGIGGLIGFCVGGPLGAGVGAALGAVGEEAYARFKPHPVVALPPPAPAPAPVVVPAAAAPVAPPAT